MNRARAYHPPFFLHPLPSLFLSLSLVEVCQVGSVSNNGYRSTRNLRDGALLADTGITPEILENVFRNTADTCELRRNIGKDRRRES